MILAKVVKSIRDEYGELLTEEFGDFEFSALPRAGDSINFEQQLVSQFATVERVCHFPLKTGLNRADYEHPLRDGPQVAVLIK